MASYAPLFALPENDMPSHIALYNPKSPTNVGAVMRAAGCYQVSSVRYNGTRFERAAKFQTDTNNAKATIPLEPKQDLLSELADDCKIVCVELVEGACPLPQFAHPEHALYVFGPEDGSLPQEMVDKAHSVVFVPTIGCMNLAASVNVLLYDRLAKSTLTKDANALIRQSRDNNNRLRV